MVGFLIDIKIFWISGQSWTLFRMPTKNARPEIKILNVLKDSSSPMLAGRAFPVFVHKTHSPGY